MTGLQPVYAGVIISEIMYNPVDGADGTDGDEFEFIELYNTGSSAISLANAYFSKGIDYTFTSAASISPGAYLVIVKDRTNFESRYPGVTIAAGTYTGSLDNDGEKVTLKDSAGETIISADYNDGDEWPEHADGDGASLTIKDTSGDPDAPETWCASARLHGTPGTSGSCAVENIVINEVLPHTDLPDKDTIELYNLTGSSVSITGWYLSDDITDPTKFQIPSQTVSAHGYATFDEDDFTSFALSELGDSVFLTAPDGANLKLVDAVKFKASENGVSFGRYPNGTGALVTLASLTLGSENSGPNVGPVIISEVMYNPSSDGDPLTDDDLLKEYIELHNVSGSTVNLEDWKLDNAVEFTFPANTTIPANGYIIFTGAPNIANFQAAYGLGSSVTVYNSWDGKLANSGESVRLYKPGDPESDGTVPYILVDRVDYKDESPWPVGSDGAGHSIERKASPGLGTDPANWQGSPIGGTPGAVNSASVDTPAVIISEVMSATSERLLRWENGVPKLGFGPSWYESGYDDSQWQAGTAPFGFGTDMGTNLESDMRYKTPSVYLRCTFSASAVTNASLQLDVNYDDGFIAYLNGKEIARKNMGPTNGFAYHDQPAFNSGYDVTGVAKTDSISFNQSLISGTNVLSIQVHNQEVENEKLRFSAVLKKNTTTLVSNTGWKYFVGVAEPSGGITDFSLVSDLDGDFCDWIELYNADSQTASLEGWTLTDDSGDSAKWIFPAGTTLGAGEYLLVMATGLDTTGEYVHTNFGLDSGGEYLGLYNSAGELVSEIPEIGKQRYFQSYGWDGQAYKYSETPTPGTQNTGTTLTCLVDKPDFDHDAGFYDAVSLTITTETAGAQIYYTTDGTEPTEASTLYTGPVSVSASQSIRARAFKAGCVASSVRTATFLIGEPTALKSLPAACLVGDSERSLFKPHGVTAIQGGDWVAQEYDWDKPWFPDTPDDYNMLINRGQPYERPASVEVFYSDKEDRIQNNCGIRFAASDYSRVRSTLKEIGEPGVWGKWNSREKPSFNLNFRNIYGDDRLKSPLMQESEVKSFASLRLRAGNNDHRNPFIIDELTRRLFLDMGHIDSRGILVNLFVNGEFRGFYNLTERMKEEFFQDWYDSEEEWDIRKVWRMDEGDNIAWDSMVNDSKAKDLGSLTNYKNFANKHMDVENFADYMLINIYGATWDWPGNNWVASRERSSQGKFRFHVWDAEGAFGLNGKRDSDYNIIDKYLANEKYYGYGWELCILYTQLVKSPEFRLLFADRVQKHFFNNGALTKQNITAQFEKLRDKINPIMNHVYSQDVNDSIPNWIETRQDNMLTQLQDAGLWPDVSVPTFTQSGSAFTLTQTGSGTIYYTTDGTDPRVEGGAVNSSASVYSNSVSPDQSTLIKARVKNGTEWGPLLEASYVNNDLMALKITEIMYNPAEGDSLEFVEIQNTGTKTLNLSGVTFSEGIDFTFSDGSSVGPGGFKVIVHNASEFESKYPDVTVAGEYADSKLNDGGELLTLSDGVGTALFSVEYDNSTPWPETPDGNGGSLVLIAPDSDPDDSANWKTSLLRDGSPGSDEREPDLSDAIAALQAATGITPDQSLLSDISGDDRTGIEEAIFILQIVAGTR
ncbi:lamin tail domain-containing protein [Desulfonema ishimotonii]|nr:lamin tail domain-containing protein [Desulfonema ishimotonii]